jgi:hypothetical protein
MADCRFEIEEPARQIGNRESRGSQAFCNLQSQICNPAGRSGQEVLMVRCRIVALLMGKASQLSWKPGQLAILAALAVVALALGQQPPASAPPAPAAPAAPAPTASSAEALALDQKIIAEAKNGSEIMANLAYLSDMIGRA